MSANCNSFRGYLAQAVSFRLLACWNMLAEKPTLSSLQLALRRFCTTLSAVCLCRVERSVLLKIPALAGLARPQCLVAPASSAQRNLQTCRGISCQAFPARPLRTSAWLLLLYQGLLWSGSVSAATVQFNGLVDAYVGSVRMAGEPQRKQTVGSSGMTTSWWGVKGKENLGSGWQAEFALATFMRVSTGELGRFSGDPEFSRDAYVGLLGDWGSVRMGRASAPNFVPTLMANPFGDSFTVSPLVLHANVATAGWSRALLTTPADTGWSHQIVYGTPRMGGWKTNWHYQSSNQPGGDRNLGMNAFYTHGPWLLTGFYERAQVSNPVKPAPMPERRNWMLGGRHDLGMAKIYATYGQARAASLQLRLRTVSLGLDVPDSVFSGAGRGSFKLAYAHSRRDQDGAVELLRRQTFSLGYDYFFSSRCDGYLVFMRDEVSFEKTGDSLILGVRQRF